MVVSLILFMASFFQILILNKTNNLSLGFRVGKFCDGGLLDIVYGFIFPHFMILIITSNLNLGFRVANFRDSSLLDIVYGFIFPNFNLK